jgi:hypothetical protein
MLWQILGYGPGSQTGQLPPRHNSVGLHSIAINNLIMTSVQLHYFCPTVPEETNSYVKLHSEASFLKKTIGFSTIKKLPRILRNPNFHNRVNKSPVLTPTMTHIYPVQSLTHRSIPLRFYLLLFFYLRLGHPSGYFPSDIKQNPIRIYFSPYVTHAAPQIAVCLFTLPNNIWRGKQVIKLPFILFSFLLQSSS